MIAASGTDLLDALHRGGAARFDQRADADGGARFCLGYRLDEAGEFDRWYALEVELSGGHRDAAGAVLAYRTSAIVAELAMIPLLTTDRVAQITPHDLWFGLSETGRIAHVGLGPAAGLSPVIDPGEAVEAAARLAFDLFAPLATAIRDRAPIGFAGLWGQLADHLASTAVRIGHRDDVADRASTDRAWAVASAVIDALIERQPRLKVRPRRHEVDHGGVQVAFSEKGTCCLIYKYRQGSPGVRLPAAERTAIVSARTCGTCPQRTEADRHERFVRRLGDLLETQAARSEA